MSDSFEWLAACFIAANLLAVILTVVDKHNARQGRWRIAESTLLLVALAGGAIGMYITMRRIRHKTRHRKFMWGLPSILILQALLVGWLWLK